MILAGDIGGTNARLAYFQPQNGHLRLISERVFPSREYSELGEIVCKFLEDADDASRGCLLSESRGQCTMGASKPPTFPGSSNNPAWRNRFSCPPLC